jgi:hypothetical protein
VLVHIPPRPQLLKQGAIVWKLKEVDACLYTLTLRFFSGFEIVEALRIYFFITQDWRRGLKGSV